METENEPVETPVRGRSRFLFAGLVVAGIVLLTSIRGLLGLYTDWLWFDDINYSDVWTGVLGAQIALSVIFVSVFLVLAWLNLVIADRVAPALRPPGPEEELLDRYHQTLGRRNGLVRFIVALLFALMSGVGVAAQWNDWVLFTNPVDFGQIDPVFGNDLSFYIFRLPFLSFVVSWFFAAFIIIGVLTMSWHYLNGGIRMQTIGRRTTPQVKAHLSVILAILALLKTADYWLDRYGLLTSQQGFARGAFYTDLNANLPAIQLLMLISLLSIGLLVLNIWRRGWALPSVAVGLWALIAIVAGGIYPSAIQQLQVSPDELSREQPFIERNIEATRFGLGLDNVETGDFTYTGAIDRAGLIDQADVFANARLLDPRLVDDFLTLNQQDRRFYDDFADRVDVDRYMIDGELTPVVVGVRELGPSSGESWEQEHAVRTHGYGIVIAPANRTNANGQPDFLVRDAPLVNDIDSLVIDQPQVYFGEGIDRYAVVATTSTEFDYIDGYAYDGTGGVPMSGLFRRLAFAFRFGELEPLISGTLTEDSEILFARDITERARRIAPFLQYDSDPYPVVVDGGISYVIDAYTTSDRLPYGQLADVFQLDGRADLRRNFSYIRNSVKVVVDGYNGTVDFYVVDPEDPIVRSYRQAFDGLFRDIDEMPSEVRDHLRYPEDLFRIQSDTWGRYQLDDASDFFDGILAWNIAENSDEESGGQPIRRLDTSDPGNPVIVSDGTRPIDPYYQITRLPDETETSFVLSRPFTPSGALRELTAYMVARTDRDGGLELRQYVMSAGNNVSVRGPFQIDELLNIDPTISEESTELGRGGSEFLAGNLVLLLVDEAVVYVRPFYVRREPPPESQNAPTEPSVEFVAVVQEDRIGFAPTYAGALAQLFDLTADEAGVLVGATSAPVIDESAGGVIIPSEQPDAMIQLAAIIDKFDEAEEALPDFAEYERLLNEARSDLQNLLASPEDGTATVETPEETLTDEGEA